MRIKLSAEEKLEKTLELAEAHQADEISILPSKDREEFIIAFRCSGCSSTMMIVQNREETQELVDGLIRVLSLSVPERMVN